jgi:hypothetical protein
MALADPVRIISWNVGAGTEETIVDRQADFTGMGAELKPDVLFMIEVVGKRGAEIAADPLG